MNKSVRENVAGLKLYVPGKPVEEVQRELGIQEIYKLASNENPFGPSPKAREAMTEVLQKASIYPDANGFYLRQALAEHWQVDIDQVILGAGSDELLQILAMTFINPGDEVICATPSFSRYEATTRLMNGICHQVPLIKYRHDLRTMASLINEKTKLIYICNPNNPTGTIVTKAELDSFMKSVPDTAVVVFDEAYSEFVEDSEYPDSLDYLAKGHQVIILRTFSKAYGLAGLRIGYGITTPEIVSYINRVRSPFNTNAVAQAGALAALKDQAYLKEVVKLNREGKAYLLTQFSGMGLPYITSETNFVMVNVRRNSVEVFQDLLKKGIIVRSGDIFGMDSWLRVTVGTMPQNHIFISALKQVLS